MIDNTCSFERMSFMDGFSRYNQIKMYLDDEKFLGFIVTSKGSHLDLDKIKAIQDMQPPKNVKELRGLQGRLVYILRFIVNLSSRYQPFTRLMKGVSFVWDDIVKKRLRISKHISLSLRS